VAAGRMRGKAAKDIGFSNPILPRAYTMNFYQIAGESRNYQ
jgi:hypothetical protein